MRTARRTLALLVVAPPFLALQAVHWIGFLLDEILFPEYRDIPVREPLFVVGMPRSGTTFLHRLIAADGERFTTPRLWHLVLAPSITERRAWGALVRLDRALGRPLGRLWRRTECLLFGWMDEVHPIRADAPEEDHLFLLPRFRCFLLVLAFPRHPAVWRLARFDRLPARERRRVVAFYRSCLQRHLHVVGADRRVVSKNPSFTPWIESLAEAFPDARFVCCVRDPRRAVPSLLSSLADGAALFGWDPAEPDMRERFVRMLVDQTGHAMEVADRGASPPLEWCRMEDLRRDPSGTVRGIYAAFGWSPTAAFAERLDAADARARRYRSGHRYTLGEYGLTGTEIERRFRTLMERFGYGSGYEETASSPTAGQATA